MKLKSLLLSFALAACLLPSPASAHENYVLTQEEIDTAMEASGPNVFSALNNANNLKVAVSVAVGSGLAIVLYLVFQLSEIGRKFDAFLKRQDKYGQLLLRIALAVSLIASAHYNAFLGPEIHLGSIPLGAAILKPALYILGVLMLFGIWSKVVGALSLLVLILATVVYKDYMLTYFNYYGEFVALILFGAGVFSLDKLFFKTPHLSEKSHEREIALIRITYGISILHPAIVFKLLNPEVIVDIANRYNLMQFGWLFPSDPLLIALGSGLAQVAVGICIILGFQTRLNTLVTFVLMLLSVIFFKEAVWPHYILLALAAYLMINNGGKYTLDQYIVEHKERLKAKALGNV